MTDGGVSRASKILRTTLRVAVLAGFVVVVNLGVIWVKQRLSVITDPNDSAMLIGIIVLSLLLYTLLMALPFVPGVEIGLSLLMLQGPPVAPFVYLATFAGLSLSFLLGHFLPYSYLQRIVFDLGLNKTSGLLESLRPLSSERRLALLRRRLPRWATAIFINYRYVMIALALNMPGNIVIGGGGGIALVAGISRVFSPVLVLLTFALAVAPVAAAFFFFGANWFNY